MVKKQRQPLRNRKSNKIRNMVTFVLVNINRRYSESNNISKWKVFNQSGKAKKALEKFASLAIIAKETKIFLSMRILQCYRLSSQKFDEGDVLFSAQQLTQPSCMCAASFYYLWKSGISLAALVFCSTAYQLVI